MINCQIKRDGKVEENITQNGLVFYDNHGVERSNHIYSDVMEVSLKEWHYQKFGIMNQHYLGKENNSQFVALHEVRPALLFSMPIYGSAVKSVYGERGDNKEMNWKTGEASLCFLNGIGGANTYLNRDTKLDILNVVVPQQFIEDFIVRNPEPFEQLSLFTNPTFDTQTIVKYNQPVETSVIKAARDIQRSRLLGNQAPKYLEAKIIDCISGLLMPEILLPDFHPFSHTVRDKMHDAKDFILSHYQDMPSLHELALTVGTNECTLKKAFKQEFGTTVFQYLFDYRMSLAAQYLLATALPIAEIGVLLGYDYQSHFCTAFKRKYGVSPMEYRLKRGDIL
jgi:AraC-like DNA-binding protein